MITFQEFLSDTITEEELDSIELESIELDSIEIDFELSDFGCELKYPYGFL